MVEEPGELRAVQEANQQQELLQREGGQGFLVAWRAAQEARPSAWQSSVPVDVRVTGSTRRTPRASQALPDRMHRLPRWAAQVVFPRQARGRGATAPRTSAPLPPRILLDT